MKSFPCFLGLCLFLLAGMGLVGLSLAQEPAANPLDGKRFVSLEKLTGGERRDGSINKIHWSIEFKGKSYSWRATDTVSVGAYEYDPTTGAVTTANKAVNGSFDAKTGVLTWGKHKYRAADAK